jgi:hypothetical protein
MDTYFDCGLFRSPTLDTEFDSGQLNNEGMGFRLFEMADILNFSII